MKHHRRNPYSVYIVKENELYFQKDLHAINRYYSILEDEFIPDIDDVR